MPTPFMVVDFSRNRANLMAKGHSGLRTGQKVDQVAVLDFQPQPFWALAVG